MDLIKTDKDGNNTIAMEDIEACFDNIERYENNLIQGLEKIKTQSNKFNPKDTQQMALLIKSINKVAKKTLKGEL